MRADILAQKIAEGHFTVDAGKRPRLAERWRELLWHLHWVSHERGGLYGFVCALVEAFPERFQTREMLAAGAVDRYDQEQCLTIWNRFVQREPWTSEASANARRTSDGTLKPATELSFRDFLAVHIGDALTSERVEHREKCDRAAIAAGVKRFNRQYLLNHCREAAQEKLATLLHDTCQQMSGCEFVGRWYCPDVDRRHFRSHRSLADCVS
jgi:hypothetical protein